MIGCWTKTLNCKNKARKLESVKLTYKPYCNLGLSMRFLSSSFSMNLILIIKTNNKYLFQFLFLVGVYNVFSFWKSAEKLHACRTLFTNTFATFCTEKWEYFKVFYCCDTLITLIQIRCLIFIGNWWQYFVYPLALSFCIESGWTSNLNFWHSWIAILWSNTVTYFQILPARMVVESVGYVVA